MNAIVEQKNFQERMKDRIRDSIGELMTDAELSEIVKRAMEDIFFKPMTLQDGYHTKEVPPFVHQLLKEILLDDVQKAVSKYIDEHKEEVQKIIQEVITLGMGKALVDAISFQFSSELMNFENNLMANIQNR
jgi:hypothetical protein